MAFDLIALGVIAILAAIGYSRGFLEELGRIFALAVATIVALTFTRPVTSWLQNPTGLDVSLLTFITFFTLFFAFLFVTRLLIKTLQVFMLTKGIRWANRTLGLMFGGLKGVVSIMILLWFMDLVPNPEYFSGIRTRSYVYRNVTNTRQWIIDSFGLDDPADRTESWVKERIGVGGDTLPD
ncbi:MAG: CvpA family protein [Fidelibacterota bacterium]